MPEFYIDPADRIKLVKKWLEITLACLHITFIGTFLTLNIIAARGIKIEEWTVKALEGIFATSGFGIGATLIILVAERAITVVLDKFSTTKLAAPAEMIETVTKKTTITPAAPLTDTPLEAKDVVVNAKGDVNVGNTES